MRWTQLIDPLNNLTLSALVAAVPVFFIFWALIKKMKGYQASLITVFLAIGLAILVYGMPVKLALLSAFHGALYGYSPFAGLSSVQVFFLTSR